MASFVCRPEDLKEHDYVYAERLYVTAVTELPDQGFLVEGTKGGWPRVLTVPYDDYLFVHRTHHKISV